jgi:hypothetical protein
VPWILDRITLSRDHGIIGHYRYGMGVVKEMLCCELYLRDSGLTTPQD